MVIRKLQKATNRKPVRSSFLRPALSTRNNFEKKQMAIHEINEKIASCLEKKKCSKAFCLQGDKNVNVHTNEWTEFCHYKYMVEFINIILCPQIAQCSGYAEMF